MARTRVCVLPWNRSQLSVPVGAFHKRRIPATSDPRRPTTKPTRRSIGGANGGIRPSPLPIAKIVFEGAPEQRRPAKFRVAFSLRDRLLPLLALPSPLPSRAAAIQATLNQRSRALVRDSFRLAFRKRGKQRERIEEIEFGLLERPLGRIIGFVKKKKQRIFFSFPLVRAFYFLRRWKRFSPRFPSPVDPFATRNNAHYIGLVNFVEQGGRGGRGGCKIVP